MDERISEREQTQDAASPMLSNLEEMAEQMPGGFFIYRADDQEDILFANDVMLDIFGCKTLDEFKELTGYTFKGLVHPDDLDEVENSILEQIAENEKKLDYVEYRIRRRDGTVRWVDDYGRFVHTRDQGDVYYVFIRDITDIRSSREENVRKTEVIEGLSIDFTSIYLLNLNTGAMRPYRLQNEYFNEIAAELKSNRGQEPDWRSILPIYAERYVLPEDRARYLREVSEERIRERLLSERSYTVDYRCKSMGEGIVYMQMSIVLIGDGEFHRHVVMGYRDVTEPTLRIQHEMADKLKTEMDLEREKHANEIKSSFLFNISHDIRTPMNAIMGFTDLSRRHINEPNRLESYLSKVDESSHHLLALIDDLLEMSRLDYGRIEIKTEPCNLREQIDIVLDMSRAQTEKKHLLLEEKLDLPNQEVLLDAHRFRRIMANLIGNAVKFTPEHGTVIVSARQKRVSESGYARYEFSVTDNGVGMSEEFMKRMYDAFEREESSTRTGNVGTGLGLAITKNLLDMMGGSIAVKSKKGKGSTFTVDLPLKLVDHDPQLQAKAAEDMEQSDHRAAGEHRILLVEDIEINRMLAETILEEAGFLVESVPDGCDAVEAINNHPLWYYDLVLMDIQMPVMNGYEATRAIRAIGRNDTDTLPIIALSANAREEDKRMSMESGMNNHIAKPFDVAHLITTVNEHIAARKQE